jgi:hypothetical protein
MPPSSRHAGRSIGLPLSRSASPVGCSKTFEHLRVGRKPGRRDRPGNRRLPVQNHVAPRSSHASLRSRPRRDLVVRLTNGADGPAQDTRGRCRHDRRQPFVEPVLEPLQVRRADLWSPCDHRTARCALEVLQRAGFARHPQGAATAPRIARGAAAERVRRSRLPGRTGAAGPDPSRTGSFPRRHRSRPAACSAG